MRFPRSVVLITALAKFGVGVGGRQGCAWATKVWAPSAVAIAINPVRMQRPPGLERHMGGGALERAAYHETVSGQQPGVRQMQISISLIRYEHQFRTPLQSA